MCKNGLKLFRRFFFIFVAFTIVIGTMSGVAYASDENDTQNSAAPDVGNFSNDEYILLSSISVSLGSVLAEPNNNRIFPEGPQEEVVADINIYQKLRHYTNIYSCYCACCFLGICPRC